MKRPYKRRTQLVHIKLILLFSDLLHQLRLWRRRHHRRRGRRPGPAPRQRPRRLHQPRSLRLRRDQKVRWSSERITDCYVCLLLPAAASASGAKGPVKGLGMGLPDPKAPRRRAAKQPTPLPEGRVRFGGAREADARGGARAGDGHGGHPGAGRRRHDGGVCQAVRGDRRDAGTIALAS
jgi:hypothetical protein